MHYSKDHILEKALIYLVFSIPLAHVLIVFFGFIPIFREFSLNQYHFIILILTYVIIIKKKLFFKSFISVFILLYVYNVFLANNWWVSLRDILPINVIINLSIIFFSDKFKIQKLNNKYKNLIFILILLGYYSFILGIDIMLAKYSSSYHAGLFGLPHISAYYLFTIIAYKVLIENTIDLFFVLALLGIFLTGVRSVIFLAGTFLILYFIFLLYQLKQPRSSNIKRLLIITVAVLFCIFLIGLLKLPLVDNIVDRLTNIDDIEDADSYSSGRIKLTKVLLAEYVSKDITAILFGSSLEEVYDITFHTFYTRIWAHNDFLMVLYVLGIVGFIFYFYYIIINPLIFILRKKSGMYLPISFLLIIILLALVNGLYTYLISGFLLYLIPLMVTVRPDKK